MEFKQLKHEENSKSPPSLSVCDSTLILQEIKPSVKTNCKRKINPVVSTIPQKQKRSNANKKIDFIINRTIDRVKLIEFEYTSYTTERLVKKKKIIMEEFL